MASQRFCLRWNNHQSNLLSVFDQLLHDEAFVDVTLAVEGQLIRAHKMVLSACSPYFQSLFVGHPDKHPIVILKDVPYCDMKSLLDFMYRGEVSVDQDRLTTFLKVAESLRIKGLTEVNEERCDLPSIANSLLNTPPPPLPPPPPPNLHRIQLPISPHMISHHTGGGVPHTTSHQQPLSSLQTQHSPKRHYPPPMGIPIYSYGRRKRGRPRKLSTGSGPPTPNAVDLESQTEDAVKREDEDNDNSLISKEVTNQVNNNNQTPTKMSPLLEQLQRTPEYKLKDDKNDLTSPSNSEILENCSRTDETTPSTSMQGSTLVHNIGSKENDKFPSSGAVTSTPISDNKTINAVRDDTSLTPKNTDENNFSECISHPELLMTEEMIEDEDDDEEVGTNNNNNSLTNDCRNNKSKEQNSKNYAVSEEGTQLFHEPVGRPPPKKRVRRRTASSTDPAEALTEMSVRGLDLFRYASISEGIYRCMECAKSDVTKTFKNKYSFQRHAFLYHEGHHRKVFPCPICTKEFSRPDKMKNHMKTVHDCFMPKECVFPGVSLYLPPPQLDPSAYGVLQDPEQC